MQILSLNHVALHVKDVDISRRFYQHVLELEMLVRPDFDFPGAWFRLGADQELHLIGGRIEPVVSHSRKSHFALSVSDIREAQTFLKDKNIEMLGPKPRPDGAWQIFFTDPDGYWIECCSWVNTG